jgi:predicted ester cyclase
VTRHDAELLWSRWIGLWNGDLDAVDTAVHPEFAFHRIPPPRLPAELGGRGALLDWIGQTRSLFDDLRFTVEVGPIIDGDLVAGRWIAEGLYRGGVPGSTAPAGTRVRFHGNDVWRAEEGLIREYWLSDDLLDLLQQLGAFPGP